MDTGLECLIEDTHTVGGEEEYAFEVFECAEED